MHPTLRAALAGSSLALGLVLPGLSSAQSPPGLDTSVDVQNLWPVAGPSDSLTLRSTTVSPSGAIGFALSGNFMRLPLSLNSGGQDRAVVDYALTTDFLWSIGLLDRIQVMLGVPVVVAQSGEGPSALGVSGGGQLGDTALRDLRLDVAIAIFQRARRADATGPGLRLDLGVTAPFGDDKGFQGSGGVTFVPTLVADWRTRYNLQFTVNVGARIRDTRYFADRLWGSQLYAGVGVAWRPGVRSRFTFAGELSNLFSLVPEQNGFATVSSSEFYVGGRYAFDQARDIEVVAGAGLPFPTDTQPTTPAWRAMLGLSYAPRGNDDDRDGVQDADDRCPGRPEDRDNHQDSDGCPDPDNDNDGVLDADDRCPAEAEDADNFQDQDGCPEADNDNDGVPDGDDLCADEALGEHPDSDRRGCPVRDSDSDSVLDDTDQCLETSAGAHPDPARPGCPLPDRDGDGVPDVQDACASDAPGEHPDRFRAGCPDVDLDRDGVLGDADRCPEQPETLNGVTDDDGCPDTGNESVTWESSGETLHFVRPLVLAAGTQRLSAGAESLLSQAAQRIRGRGGEVARVVIRVDPARTPNGATEAARLASLVGDVFIARRIPQRSITTEATLAPAPVTTPPGTPRPTLPRVIPGTVRISIQTNAPR